MEAETETVEPEDGEDDAFVVVSTLPVLRVSQDARVGVLSLFGVAVASKKANGGEPVDEMLPFTLPSGLNVEPPDRTESVKIYGGGGEPCSDTNECAVCKPAHEREIAHRSEEANDVEYNTVRVRDVATAALGTTPILADDDDMETDEMGGKRAVTLSAYT